MATARTRRELLRGASSDEAILRRLLELQLEAATAYEVALAEADLEGGTAALVRTLRRQEDEHADGLVNALRGYGGARRRRYRAGEVPGLGQALDARGQGFARFAARFEADSVRACYEAIAAIRNEKLLAGVGAIMASEAQHLTLWREVLGRDPVPRAFESGARAG